ncbi:sigma-70 family RNA polymerase sigma factor [Acidithiobacillus sp.]|uniref:sigma-70 family RNA polymerase sigma factor n=1 Tax=Acidithiobacillus sp. TaxID=1872118 RepID=UPI003563B7C3
MAVLVSEEFSRDLQRGIGTLPEKEQLVLALYYQDELTLKEIGSVLEVSESRVSQIMRQAVLRLRTTLGDWRDDGL